jgi:hypothetical protein
MNTGTNADASPNTAMVSRRTSMAIAVVITAALTLVTFVLPYMVPYEEIRRVLFDLTGKWFFDLKGPFDALRFVGGLSAHPIVVVSDAVGLAAFATTGAMVGVGLSLLAGYGLAAWLVYAGLLWFWESRPPLGTTRTRPDPTPPSEQHHAGVGDRRPHHQDGEEDGNPLFCVHVRS